MSRPSKNERSQLGYSRRLPMLVSNRNWTSERAYAIFWHHSYSKFRGMIGSMTGVISTEGGAA